MIQIPTARKLGATATVAISLALAACTSATAPTTTTTGTATTSPTTTATTQPPTQVVAQQNVAWEAMTGAAGSVWLLGEYICWAPDAEDTCLTMLRSTNAGKSFTPVSVPPVVLSTEGASVRVSLTFANRDDGYLYVESLPQPRLYWTEDGGETWRLVQPGGKVTWREDSLKGWLPLSSLVIASGRAYGLIQRGCSTARCSAAVLVSSAVTSRTWTTRPLPVVTSGASIDLAASGTKLWLVVIGAHGGPARLFVSKDGGRSFSKLISTGMGGEYCTATATSVKSLWGYCIQANMGYALRSTDGGSHFSHVVVPPNPSESLDSVLPVSDSEAVFEVPDFDSLLLTRDGGEHFSPVLRSQALYASFLIAFVNATTWLLLGTLSSSGGSFPGPTLLWRTTDAGFSWQRPQAPQGVSTSSGAATPWTAVDCGSDFLSPGDSASFIANFDYPFCVGLRSATDMVWEVMAPGGTVTYTANGPNSPPKSKVTTTRGGSMVAVLRCPLDDSTCADPNFTHPFSDFTVYPSPDSTSPLSLNNAGFNAPFLAVESGFGCLDVFDSVTGEWYSGLGFNIGGADAFHFTANPLAAPPPEHGAVALKARAPSPTTTSCQQGRQH